MEETDNNEKDMDIPEYKKNNDEDFIYKKERLEWEDEIER